jgi:hypothetical protein
LHTELMDLYMRMTLLRHRVWADERGEGVISAAIAVLVMAALGAIMWLGFKAIFTQASSNTSNQVQCVGGAGGGNCAQP